MKNRTERKSRPLPHGKDECDAVQIDLVDVIARKPKPKKRRTNGI